MDIAPEAAAAPHTSNFARLLLPAVVCTLILPACASTFVSSWSAPDAEPLEVEGSRVAAAIMTGDGPSRRMGEDTLAREISQRGGQGIPLYKLIPDADLTDEVAARAALERAGVNGVVTMRPVGVDKEVVASPEPIYPGYWGGYHGYGWANTWGGEVYTNTIVYVETQVYSLDQNKLVWSGQSKTTNPGRIDDFVEELAAATAAELEKQGLIRPQS